MTRGPSDRTRRAVVVSLLAAHVLAYAALVAAGVLRPLEALRIHMAGVGKADPQELFNVLLLVSNFVIAAVLLRGGYDLLVGGGIMFLVAAHGFVGHRLAPDALTSGAILMVSVIVLYVGVKINTLLPARHWYAFMASYILLFLIFIGLLENAEALFLLFLLGLAATARSPRLLAGFWAVVLSFTFCQPYAWEAALISIFVLAAIFSARGRVPSPTATVFLACGLVLVFLVLFPVVVIVMGENLHSMERVARDREFQRAVLVTLRTATLSTIFLVLFTVPLAYALSRLHFRGRTLLLSLIDIPIVVPQSVAAVALMRVFGRQQILGELIEHYLKIEFDGTMWGICLAQVFVAMPFIARSALAAFEAVPEDLELAARTLGASSWSAFWRVALPLASRGIFLGAVLAWARAAGEFGALMLIAQNPRTAPMAVYYKFQSSDVVQAAPMGAALLLFSLAMFFLLQFVSRTLPSVHGRKERAR